MLKIKDEVKLEDLKKFGFDDNDEEGFFEYWVGNTQVLTINKWNRLIKITQYLINSIVEERKVQEEILDTLYDLITAGLVEKV